MLHTCPGHASVRCLRPAAAQRLPSGSLLAIKAAPPTPWAHRAAHEAQPARLDAMQALLLQAEGKQQLAEWATRRAHAHKAAAAAGSIPIRSGAPPEQAQQAGARLPVEGGHPELRDAVFRARLQLRHLLLRAEPPQQCLHARFHRQGGVLQQSRAAGVGQDAGDGEPGLEAAAENKRGCCSPSRVAPHAQRRQQRDPLPARTCQGKRGCACAGARAGPSPAAPWAVSLSSSAISASSSSSSDSSMAAPTTS